MENPVCSMEKKFDQCSSSSTTVVCEKDRDHVTFDYAHFNSDLNAKLMRNNMMNKHRWMLPFCTIAAVLIALGSLLGLVAVYVELRRAYTVLETNRNLIHAQDMRILNQTHALDKFRTDLKFGKGPSGGSSMASPPASGQSTAPEFPGDSTSTARSGNVYFRWGADDCPNSSSLIYTGIAASGSSLSVAKGSGGNFLCMTSQPQYDLVTPGKQEPRGRLVAVEYRNGNTFGDQGDLHGHDVPCAACLTQGGRQATIMIPGKASCPDDNWTREYYGILMSSRYNNVRTSYICVDRDAETRDGTMTEDGNSSLLFPVEGLCGSGGGLPCGPYVDGNELQCVVCSK